MRTLNIQSFQHFPHGERRISNQVNFFFLAISIIELQYGFSPFPLLVLALLTVL